MTTHYHSQYWAHALTLRSTADSIDNLSRSISNARVDLDPHQVDAALFAFRSPLSKGVILVDDLRYSGQVGEGGVRLSTNTETAGRYHSKWLDMMYPRLFLARNLLCREGAIFVSVDDHEVHNLRLLMDEVFGAENFNASVIWQKVYSPKNSARHFSEDHDYVVVYARDSAVWTPELLPRTREMEARYSNPDNDTRGPWKSGDLSARNYYGQGLPEPLPTSEPELKTIFDMGLTRLRNVTKEITAGEAAKLSGMAAHDVLATLGCRVLRLTSSNFKIWTGEDAAGDAVSAKSAAEIRPARSLSRSNSVSPLPSRW